MLITYVFYSAVTKASHLLQNANVKLQINKDSLHLQVGISVEPGALHKRSLSVLDTFLHNLIANVKLCEYRYSSKNASPTATPEQSLGFFFPKIF